MQQGNICLSLPTQHPWNNIGKGLCCFDSLAQCNAVVMPWVATGFFLPSRHLLGLLGSVWHPAIWGEGSCSKQKTIPHSDLVRGGGLPLKQKDYAVLHQLHSLLWDMWAFGNWPRKNILRMLKLQIRGNAGMCLLSSLGHLQEAEPRTSFTALSLHMSPFALAWVLSHAVMGLSEREDDRSHDIIVLTFPLWKPKYYVSLGFCPGFRRKRDCINVACVCTSVPSVTLSPLLTSEPVDHSEPFLVGPKSGAPKDTKFLLTL